MKKAFSILEITLYVIIVSVVGVYITFIVSRYFEYLEINKNSINFSKNYDTIIRNLYSKNKDGWNFYGSAGTGFVIFSNSGNYQGIACLETGIVFTNFSTTSGSINWTGNYEEIYTGFDCEDLTGVSVSSGYWLQITTDFFGRDLGQKYYFSNGL